MTSIRIPNDIRVMKPKVFFLDHPFSPLLMRSASHLGYLENNTTKPPGLGLHERLARDSFSKEPQKLYTK